MGLPYVFQFAYTVFSGDTEAIDSCDGYDKDAMYDVTRNMMLGQGISILYPEIYRAAEVFLDGCSQCSTEYMFSAEFSNHNTKKENEE